VVACVVLRPGHEADGEALRDHTLEHLARSKVPRRWYFVDALPRNATGKVVKDELRRSLADAPSDAEVGTDR
jgi:long-chain acyl-CoA synthetase